MLHHLRYNLKLLARSRSWRFTSNTVRRRQSDSLAVFKWQGHDIHYRPGTTDGAMIYDALLKSEYYVPASVNPDVILDVGSHIGSSILYFHHQFPSAKIYGFEPHPENFRILKLNLSRIPLVSIFNFGLNSSDKKLEIPFDSVNFDAFSTSESARLAEGRPLVKCEVRNIATTLPALGIETVDLIKLDCEGAEYDVLRALPAKLLAGCKWIVGEVHGTMGFELLAFLTSRFDLDLRKKMFAPKFLVHACNKTMIAQLKGSFRRSRLNH